MNPEGVILSTGTSAVIIALLVQWLKTAPWFPWLSTLPGYGRINLAVSAFLAALASFGVQFAYNAEAGTLIISGLTVAGLVSGAWHWLTQLAAQHVVYQAAVAPKARQEEILRRLGGAAIATPGKK